MLHAGKRVRSTPISLMTFNAVRVSMPGMRVKSTPLALNSELRASKRTEFLAGVLRLGGPLVFSAIYDGRQA